MILNLIRIGKITKKWVRTVPSFVLVPSVGVFFGVLLEMITLRPLLFLSCVQYNCKEIQLSTENEG